MHASTALLLAGAALAGASPEPTDIPVPADLVARDGKDVGEFSPWVEVDNEGQPVTTHTPVVTTTRGQETTLDAAPYELTGSVFTLTSWADVFTSTGEPPNPTGNPKKKGEGAFSSCVNTDGEYAPICRPSHNSTLLTGNHYYITWDPEVDDLKPKSNISYEVRARIDFLNHTTNEWEELLTTDKAPARWGYLVWGLGTDQLRNDFDHPYTNVTLQLRRNLNNSAETTAMGTAMPLVLESPTRPPPRETPMPDSTALKIALPAVLGSFVLLFIIIFIWNRKSRHIGIGNVMGRGRNGYTGSARRRLFRRNKDAGIQLDTRPVPPSPTYRDVAPPSMPRRDSDDLESLAGSPVAPNFRQQGTTGGRNAFRDEMSRQDRQRQDDRNYL
jgi:hypothetical protein